MPPPAPSTATFLVDMERVARERPVAWEANRAANMVWIVLFQNCNQKSEWNDGILPQKAEGHRHQDTINSFGELRCSLPDLSRCLAQQFGRCECESYYFRIFSWLWRVERASSARRTDGYLNDAMTRFFDAPIIKTTTHSTGRTRSLLHLSCKIPVVP
jgi:hypothetical protein